MAPKSAARVNDWPAGCRFQVGIDFVPAAMSMAWSQNRLSRRERRERERLPKELMHGLADGIHRAGTPPAETWPEVVYHYTPSVAALTGMLSGRVWAVDYRAQADREEIHHWEDILRETIRQARDLSPLAAAISDRVLQHWEKLRFTHIGCIFVSCFSEVNDELSQWRSFADDAAGFMLGIRISEMNMPDDLPTQTCARAVSSRLSAGCEDSTCAKRRGLNDSRS